MSELNNIVDRIVKWNEDRDNMAFNLNHELRMLLEEAAEIQKATTVVDKIHELADFTFVYFGSFGKIQAASEEEGADINFLGNASRYLLRLVDGIGSLASLEIASIYRAKVGEDALNKALTHNSFSELLDRVMDAVVTANEAKPTTKVDGKIIKGDDYVSPTEKIAALVAEWEVEHGLTERA